MWGRIDDGFDDHPKVVALLDEDDQTAAGVAIGLWTLCFTWAHRNTRKRGKTPGLIPAGLPRRFLGQAGKDAAQLLVKHRLWIASDDGGWQIHDFEHYLPTEETREARSEAGRRGAARRWAGHQKAAESDEETDEDGNLPSACHDGDGNAVASDGSCAPAPWAISKEIAPSPTPTPNPDDPPSVDLFGAHAEAAAEKPKTRRKRGSKPATRIPDDFRVTDAMATWAAEETPAVDGRFESANFVDHWRAADRNAEKRDWVAAWRTWMRRAQKDLEGRGITRRWQPSSNDQGRAGSELVRRESPPEQRRSTGSLRAEQALGVAAELDRELANGGTR